MATNKLPIIRVTIRRGTATESRYQEYQVPLQPGQSVMGVLHHIYDNLDPSLTFACSCRIGLCACCLVRVDGKVLRACTTLVKGDMLIEPYKTSATIRDLVVELPAEMP